MAVELGKAAVDEGAMDQGSYTVSVMSHEAPYWVLSDLASFPDPPSFSLFAVQKAVSKWGKPITLYEEKVMCYQLELINVL